MKTLLLLFTLLLSLLGKSQSYIPLPDSGATWVNEHKTYILGEFMEIIYDSYQYTYYCSHGTDTVINATNYTKLEKCLGGYKGAFRNESGRVFYVPGSDSLEYLLMDFTAEPGDTLFNVYFEDDYFESPEIAEYIVVEDGSEDSVFFGGIYRKVVYLEGDITWYEGIGSPTGLFRKSGQNISNYFIQLFCFSIDNQRIYPFTESESCYLFNTLPDQKRSQKIKIYPNPTTASITLSDITPDQFEKIEIFNLFGELVYENPLLLPYDISNLTSGNYIIHIYTNKTTYRQRITKL